MASLLSSLQHDLLNCQGMFSLVKTLRRLTASAGKATAPLNPEPVSDLSGQKLVVGERWGALQIIERLGGGAFGDVYRAWDSILEREVALKLLRNTSVMNQPQTLLEEGRLLAKLRNENIATVYGVDHREDCVGLWMEFIRGRNLASILATDGPLGAREAALVGIEVCRAISTVHNAGLVHRDIKAENIMREDGGRIVLVDFGLGQRLWSPNVRERLAGTPLYMPPEAFDGHPLGPRSDIYAIGVLLFHLTTDRYPVEAASFEELKSAHLTGSRTSLRKLRPALPDTFTRTVEKAISPNPAGSFGSAAELIQALEGVLVSAGAGHRRRPSRRTVLAMTALSSAASAWVWWSQRANFHVGPGAQLLLANFENASGDPHMSAVTALLRDQLGQSRHVNLVDDALLVGTLRRMSIKVGGALKPEVAREAAWRMRVPLVVFGAITRLGADYNLDVQLVETGHTPQAPARKIVRSFPARDRESVMGAVREASSWIRSQVGESSRDLALLDRLPEDVTTPSWAALADYAEGERLKWEEKAPEAVLALRSALQKDPDFTLAAVRAGDILYSQNRDEVGLGMYLRAIGMLPKRSVTEREELRLRGLVAADTWDLKEADLQFARWSSKFPNDPRPFHYRYLPLAMLGKPDEAIANLQKAIQLGLQVGYVYAALVECLTLAGRFSEAEQALRELRRKGDAQRADRDEGELRFVKEDFFGSRTYFQRLRESEHSFWRRRGYLYEAVVCMERAQWTEASELLNAGARPPVSSGEEADVANLHIASAWLAWHDGDKKKVVQRLSVALNLESGPFALAHAGTLLARVSAAEQAQSLLRMARKFQGVRAMDIAARRISGELALANGRTTEALSELRAAAELEPPLAYREYYARVLELVGRREEARLEYENTSLHPQVMWLVPMLYPPGYWGEASRRISRAKL